MAEVLIKRIMRSDDRSLPVFAEIEKLIGEIQRRAFALCAERGFSEGHALEDWLRAERELCWPAAELVERDKDFVCEMAVPGYEPAQIEVTATPRELIVHARAVRSDQGPETTARKEGAEVVRWTAFGSNDVYRRVEFGGEVDVAKMTASLRNGLLKIVAPKLEVTARKVAVSAAA